MEFHAAVKWVTAETFSIGGSEGIFCTASKSNGFFYPDKYNLILEIAFG